MAMATYLSRERAAHSRPPLTFLASSSWRARASISSRSFFSSLTACSKPAPLSRRILAPCALKALSRLASSKVRLRPSRLAARAPPPSGARSRQRAAPHPRARWGSSAPPPRAARPPQPPQPTTSSLITRTSLLPFHEKVSEPRSTLPPWIEENM